MRKKTKQPQPTKKIRTWYGTYRSRMQAIDQPVLSLKVWAALEVDSCVTGSTKEREINRFLVQMGWGAS